MQMKPYPYPLTDWLTDKQKRVKLGALSCQVSSWSVQCVACCLILCKSQRWLYFHIQHSVMALRCSAETKLNVCAGTTTNLLPCYDISFFNFDSLMAILFPQTRSFKSATDAQQTQTRMWANAQCDGRPAKYRWCPLFNAANFGRRPLPECRAVTLPRRETRWN